MPKAPEWLNADIQEFYPICQGNIRAIQHAIRDKRGVDIAYMTISNRMDDLKLARPGKKSKKTTASSAQGDTMAEVAEVFPAQMTRDADTPPHDPVLPIGDMVPVMGELVEPLSSSEAQTLAHYEAIIAKGLKVFVEVGQALLAIREQKLYREAFGTFEDYLRQRWDLSRSYAHRLIDAAEVTERLLPVGNILPMNEAQVRPLTSLPPEQQQEVWTEAVNTAPSGRVTAQHVKQTTMRVTGKASAVKSPTRPAMPKTAAQTAQAWFERLRDALSALNDTMNAFQKAGGVTLLAPEMDRYHRQYLLGNTKFLIEQRLSRFCQALEKVISESDESPAKDTTA